MSDGQNGRGFGYWLNIFADLAVVAGIVFLGMELRENSELLEVQTQADLFLPRLELATWRAGFQSQGIFRWPLGEYGAQMKPFFGADFVRFVEDSVVAR